MIDHFKNMILKNRSLDMFLARIKKIVFKKLKFYVFCFVLWFFFVVVVLCFVLFCFVSVCLFVLKIDVDQIYE